MTREQQRQLAAQLKSEGMRCNCDMDNWQPNESTGHSDVCRIHKAVKESVRLALHIKRKANK